MIKLYDCVRKTDVYIKKSVITGMIRKENTTDISSEDFPFLIVVNETPEEILAMPDIETTEKVIDWEQRRYEIAKDMLPAIYVDDHPQEGEDYLTIQQAANEAVRYADALIKELKKGQSDD